MKPHAAKRLVVNDRVCWEGDRSIQGTVIETGYNTVKIEWGDGQVGIQYHATMGSVSRYLPPPTDKPRPGETWENLARGEVGI